MVLARLIIASGMHGTGVSTVAQTMRTAAARFDVIDAGARWAEIHAACLAGFSHLIAVTTDDIVAVSSTYALIKLVREHFPESFIEVLVNHSGEREALRTYERVQYAASQFLRETVSYGGSIPDDPALGPDVVSAIHNVLFRLENLPDFSGRSFGASYG